MLLKQYVKNLKFIYEQVRDLGSQLYEDRAMLVAAIPEENRTSEHNFLPSQDDYHHLSTEVHGLLEAALNELEGKEGWHLCTSSFDDEPCYNLADESCHDAYWPTDEAIEQFKKDREEGKVSGVCPTQYEYCPDCIAAFKRGLTYRDLIGERKRANRKAENLRYQAKLSERIRAADPKRADYYAAQERKRKERLEELRRESEEMDTW